MVHFAETVGSVIWSEIKRKDEILQLRLMLFKTAKTSLLFSTVSIAALKKRPSKIFTAAEKLLCAVKA